MVALSKVKESNALIPTSLPSSPVAVFVGGTKGIGAHTLLAFASHTSKLFPRIIVVARSSTPIIDQARTLCPSGTITFLPCDASLLKDVDRTCTEIGSLLGKDGKLNLLFMSQGTLDFSSKTSEDLPLMAALAFYSRMRFAMNLLPLLQRGDGWRRVVNVLTGGKEGLLYAEDWYMEKMSLMGMEHARGHGASMLTLGMECVAEQQQQAGVEGTGKVAFVHGFPGFVKTDIGNTMKGFAGVMIRVITPLISPFVNSIGGEECGERHVFMSTSDMFGVGEADGVVCDGVERAKGTDGVVASGSYSVDERCDAGDVVGILEKLRQDGTKKKLWEFAQQEMERCLNVKA